MIDQIQGQRIAALEQELRNLREENEALTERAEDITLLSIISERIALEKEEKGILEVALEGISAIKDLYYVAFARVHEDNIVIEADCAPIIGVSNEGSVFPISDHLWLPGKNIVVEHCHRSICPPFIPYEVKEFRVVSYCLIPLEIHEIRAGFFIFVNYLKDSNHLQFAIPLISRVVDLVAARVGALKLLADINDLNRNLEKKVRQRTEDLEKINRRLTREIARRRELGKNLKWQLRLNLALAELSGKLIDTADDIKSMAELILFRSKELTNSEHGYVSLIDPRNGDNMSYTLTEMMGAGKCQLSGKEKKIVFPMRDDNTYPGLWGHCLNTREAFYTNTPNTHPASRGAPADHIEINNFLSIPVLLGDQLVGQISLANAVPAYTQKDIEAIRRVANIYALAINRYQNQQEREDLMANLRQAQKLEAIGTLAGGIAHDFNNILAGIFGFIDLAKNNLNKNRNNIGEYLDEALKASIRARDLVKQILTFSRKTEVVLQPIQVQPILKEIIKFLRSTIPSSIQITQNLSFVQDWIRADPIQIHQIIMNLTTNAYQAMSETGGVLTINLDETVIEVGDKTVGSDLEPGKYLRLEIRDSGSGISRENLKRIFEPYFTTRTKSGGTGLGLAVVHGIVKSHKGHISVFSEEGRGTSFQVLFPLIENPEFKDEKPETEEKLRGRECILFVDDEETLVKLGKLTLEDLGYSVIGSSESPSAFDAFIENMGAIDLIITDLNMPDISGTDLASRIRELNPDIPIILCTGFNETVDAEIARSIGIDAFFTKPVSWLEMVRTIRQLLDEHIKE